MKMCVSLTHFSTLGYKKFLRIELLPHCAKQQMHKAFATCQPSSFEQRSFCRDVLGCQFLALSDRAYAMTGFKTQIPHSCYHALDGIDIRCKWIGLQQNQDIDIRVRIQLAPAVATYSDECSASG